MAAPAFQRLDVDERRRQLLALGAELFAQHAYDQLSMRKIAKAAGISHALLYRLGLQHFGDHVLLAWSRSSAGAGDPAWRALAKLAQTWRVPDFPLKAADFIARGVAAGPALGAAMRAAEAAWIAADFPADRTAIEAIADRAAPEAKSTP